MEKVIAWIRKAASDINQVAVALGQTIHELVGSKRAALGALALVVNAASAMFPETKWLAQVLPAADIVFGVLAVLDTFRPLGVEPGKG